jgi:hypothetical protein
MMPCGLLQGVSFIMIVSPLLIKIKLEVNKVESCLLIFILILVLKSKNEHKEHICICND